MQIEEAGLGTVYGERWQKIGTQWLQSAFGRRGNLGTAQGERRQKVVDLAVAVGLRPTWQLQYQQV